MDRVLADHLVARAALDRHVALAIDDGGVVEREQLVIEAVVDGRRQRSSRSTARDNVPVAGGPALYVGFARLRASFEIDLRGARLAEPLADRDGRDLIARDDVEV